jgi:IS1 family transposase
MASMKKLAPETRSQTLHLLMEGSSIRAAARITGVSKTTILKLIEDAGRAATWYQDRVLRNLACTDIQTDEIWGFVNSKAANTPRHKQGFAGDIWVWIATCRTTKLVPSWYVGNRDGHAARAFMFNLASRVNGNVQISSDAFKAYAPAVERAFPNADYGQVVKVFGVVPEAIKGRYSPPACLGSRKVVVKGNPDPALICTSHSERNNLNVRMHSRRMTRLTNAFSKKVENHVHAMALHFLYYNFVRVHQTLKVSPAMAAGVTNRLWEMKDVVAMLEAWEVMQERFVTRKMG